MSLVRPAAPTPWPVTNPTTPAGKKAAELHADWVKRFAWVEQVEAEHAKARSAKTDALEALRAATTPKAQAAAEATLAAAVAKLSGPWMARLDGPIRATGEAQSAFQEHVDSNVEELLTEPELGDEAEAAQARVVAAIERLVAEVGNWQDTRTAHAQVVRLASQLQDRDLPVLDGDLVDLAKAAQKLLADSGSVKAPKLNRHALRQRAVDRGEAEWQDVGGGAGHIVKFVRHQ
jgi:hypothetical protein